MKRRRVIQLVLLLLLAGAVVNVAVAWGFALYPIQSSNASVYGGRWKHWAGLRPWEVTTLKDLGVNPPHALYSSEVHNIRALWRENATFGITRGEVRLPTVQYGPLFCFLQSGWPIRCMYAEFWSHSEAFGDFQVRYAIDSLLQPDKKVMGPHVRALPCGILYTGFAINTIFYAAILWMVFFVPGTVKRMLRRRRGLCPACAYPVGASLVCTECGTPYECTIHGGSA